MDGNPAVEYAGGTQANMASVLWGIGPDGDLIIDANPDGIGTSFSFKEVPVNGSTPPPVLVPLPAAAWQGLAGLLGLGLIAYGKSLKKLMA
jgi:hypothetical protein